MEFIDWCIREENGRGYVHATQKERVLGTYEAAREKIRKEYSEPVGPANGNQPVRSPTNRTSSAATGTNG
jgi:hypothetical protein